MSILPAARSESAEKTNTTVKHNCFFSVLFDLVSGKREMLIINPMVIIGL